MNVTRRHVLYAAIAASIFVPSAAFGHSGDDHEGGTLPSVRSLTKRQRHDLRVATQQFGKPTAAIAAGYLPSDVCAELPGVGGMGFHYVNPAYLGDGVIDPAKPEILVYVPAANGKVRLGALEYFAVDADQNLATDNDRPSLFGHPFDGPMPGHEPGMPIHYDLHVWVFVDNPAGELAPWNPAVSCSVGTADDHEGHDHDD